MGLIAEAQVELSWPQRQAVPLGGHYDVYADGQTGEVDFSAKLNALPVEAWPGAVGKRGFGLGLFGAGMFGFGNICLPFGEGRFGMGRFGFGARMHEFLTGPHADGDWRFAVVAVDPAGNPVEPAGAIEAAASVAGSPAAPSDLAATAWEDETLTLEWTISPDDEA